MGSKVIDMTSQICGMLTVISRAGVTTDGKAAWLTRCECGNEQIVSGHYLRSGHTYGCGRHNFGNVKHGLIKTPEYKVWKAMNRRCNNPNSKDYKHYGSRGIKVCNRWKDYAKFYADMGSRPSPKHSIERMNNDKGYSPQNCRWATPLEQSNNRRNNLLFEIDGGVYTGTQAAKKVGIPYKRLHLRLRNGWSKERALYTP